MLTDDNDDVPNPTLDALVAANVALMTAWADPAADARVDAATQRLLIARKVVANLRALRRHAHLSPALRAVMGNAQLHWVAVARRLAAAGAKSVRPAWH